MFRAYRLIPVALHKQEKMSSLDYYNKLFEVAFKINKGYLFKKKNYLYIRMIKQED